MHVKDRCPRWRGLSAVLAALCCALAVLTLPGCGGEPAPEQGSQGIEQSNSAQLRAVINAAIIKLKAEDIDWVFDQFFNPVEIAEIKKSGDIDKEKKIFKDSDLPKAMLQCLESVTDENIALKEDELHCYVKMDPTIPKPDHLTFEKVDGVWHLNAR